MTIAERNNYLADIRNVLRQHWPENRIVNIVCHGHSVPAGYFATPRVDSLNAYPHLLWLGLKDRFPFAVVNVIVTAIGGETSDLGAARFEKEVLCHHPDLITIDYGLNDRRIGLSAARQAWSVMIESALRAGIRVMLLTPTFDMTQAPDHAGAEDERALLSRHSDQIIRLAENYEVGLADSYGAFQVYCSTGQVSDLLSWDNHPNRRGHELVVKEILRWFPA